MQTAYQHTIKKTSLKSKIVLSEREDKIDVSLLKKLDKRKRLIKRISPFLLLSFFLPVQFIHSFFIEKIGSHSLLLQLCILIFLEVNILITDFALWNYYGNNKILRIWLIEGSLAFMLIYLVA